MNLSPGTALLCAYLALAPRHGRTRSSTLAQLFAGCPEGAARRRLNTALWRLRQEVRRAVGVDLVAASGSRIVALNPDAALTVDVDVFERLVAPVLRTGAGAMTDCGAEHLERATDLYRGALVEPCDDEWVLADRHRFEDLYIAALDYLVQFHGARGDVAAVTRFGAGALELEPLREDLYRHLMTAYAAAGRDDLVERQFERCRRTLRDELGADPMPETVALYARLMRGDSGHRVTVTALVADLERARREITRLAGIVDRALDRVSRLPGEAPPAPR